MHRYGVIAALACTVGLAACGAIESRTKTSDEAQRAAVARILTETATRVAASKVGAKVCRQLPVGISEHDWISGVVTEIEGDKIRVRIEDPGRFPETIAGTTIARGALISDTPLNWVPCV